MDPEARFYQETTYMGDEREPGAEYPEYKVISHCG